MFRHFSLPFMHDSYLLCFFCFCGFFRPVHSLLLYISFSHLLVVSSSTASLLLLIDAISLHTSYCVNISTHYLDCHFNCLKNPPKIKV
ncbi:hypothetical protein QBC44DRAFT_327023 [Cladorrhinum sp. PSN332]|nr:hypothetical protein QBC44DRAFT_327023 [Cladorrhinum sp. PSN332]